MITSEISIVDIPTGFNPLFHPKNGLKPFEIKFKLTS